MSNQNRCIICPKCSINNLVHFIDSTVIFFQDNYRKILKNHTLFIMSNKSITGWKFKYDF